MIDVRNWLQEVKGKTARWQSKPSKPCSQRFPTGFFAIFATGFFVFSGGASALRLIGFSRTLSPCSALKLLFVIRKVSLLAQILPSL